MIYEYDEDLTKNPFLIKLKSKYSALYEDAFINNWIICVPCFDSIQGCMLLNDLNNDNNIFLQHIFKSNNDEYEDLTGNNNNVRYKIQNGFISSSSSASSLALAASNDQKRETKILFVETFYDVYKNSCKILCIEHPLHKTSNNYCYKYNTIKTLDDCINILKQKKILKNINKIIKMDYNFYKHNLNYQINLINGMYEKCIKLLLNTNNINNNLKIAIESYILNNTYNYIYTGLCTYFTNELSEFNKHIHLLSELSPDNNNNDYYYAARISLNNIVNHKTIIGKLLCIKKCVKIIQENNLNKNHKNNEIKKNENINSENKSNENDDDNYISILIYIIIKSKLPTFLIELKFIDFYNLSENHEISYWSSLLNAAISVIKTLDYSKLYLNKLMMKYDNNKYVNMIINNNLTNFSNNLINNNPSNESDEKLLCHPLCKCCKCESVVANDGLENLEEGLQGFTLLHIACALGKIDFVNILLKEGEEKRGKVEEVREKNEKGEYEKNGIEKFEKNGIEVFGKNEKEKLEKNLEGEYEEKGKLEKEEEEKTVVYINQKDNNGLTALHYAAKYGYHNCLLLLMYRNADITLKDNDDNTILHLAAINGHDKCIKAILFYSEHSYKSLNVNCINKYGETPLYLATKFYYKDIINDLLHYNADPKITQKYTNLNCFQITKSMIILKQLNIKHYTKNLLKPGKSVNGLESSLDENSKIDYGIEPYSDESIKFLKELFKNIANGNLTQVKKTLGFIDDVKINSNKKIEKCHPLCQCEECLEFDEDEENKIISNNNRKLGINIDICNYSGFTGLHIAVIYRKDEIVKLLIDIGVSPNVRTYRDFYTPLHIACKMGLTNISKIILKSPKCDINVKDKYGNTPLHYACESGNESLVKILIKFEPNVQIRNAKGNTPLDIATKNLFISIVTIIQQVTQN